jgi:CheY-like chemotaxis protein
MPSANRPRLLLVEDDPQLGPLIARVLDEVYDVTLFADGAEALSNAQEQRYDAMIIDRRLPLEKAEEIFHGEKPSPRVRSILIEAAEAQNTDVGVLMDLTGPSIRTGDVEGAWHLRPGNIVEFRTDESLPPTEELSTTVNYPGITKDLKVGDGFWKTATKLGDYRQDFIDVKEQVVASWVIVEESGYVGSKSHGRFLKRELSQYLI